MATYTIIGGVDGVGKSSFIGTLKMRDRSLGKIIDVDKLTVLHGGDAIAGGEAAIKEIEYRLERNLSFTQKTTLSGFKTETTIRRAKEKGYEIRLFYIALDNANQSIERVANRVKNGGHNIPTDKILHRFERRWEDVAKILPYCDIAEFYDNANGFEPVAEDRNGEVVPVGDRHPEWLTDFRMYLSRI